MSDQTKPFFHQIPKEISSLLKSDSKIDEIWKMLTPIAQNEWICYVISPKLTETKEKHLQRLKQDLLKGKKRPCCWAGCPHRNPNSAKWFERNKK